jgi:uncharacterized repeat protein (TIGR01451 family)
MTMLNARRLGSNLSIAMIGMTLFVSSSRAAYCQQTPSMPDAQAVSQTGLLPVYGVDFTFDPTWVSATPLTTESATQLTGVNAAFQQVWDALKRSGFNAIRFPVDVRDPQSANRVANLCVWSKTNNVMLVPVLIGAQRGQPVGADFAQNVASFTKNLVAALRIGGDSSLAVYARLLLYQLENNLNHVGLHGAMSPQSAQLRLLQAASALRRAEQESLKDTGIDATPVMVSASFDYELIRARAIAGATWDESAYAQAQRTFKEFLVELAAAPDIDTIGVEWFPGSQGAGSVEKLPDLLRSLSTDLAGKQIVLSTGYSTAFHTTDEQKSFYAVAFSNLVDYRASQGGSSQFIGVFFHEATNGTEPNRQPPTPSIVSEMAGWDWPAKADELQALWSGKSSSPALTWWLTKVENNMGLLGLKLDPAGTPTIINQPAQQALQQIATMVSDANAAIASQQQNSPPPEAAPLPQTPPASPPGYGVPTNNPLKEHFQAGLGSLLDAVFSRLGSTISTLGTGGSPTSPGPAGGNPWPPVTGGTPPPGEMPSPSVVLETIDFNPKSPQKDGLVTFDVTLRNTSAASDASALTVAALDQANASRLGMDSERPEVTVARGTTKKVTLSWMPPEAGTYAVLIKVTDPYLRDLDTRALSILVAPGQGTLPPGPGTQPGDVTPPPLPPGGTGGTPPGGAQDPSRPHRVLDDPARLSNIQMAGGNVAGPTGGSTRDRALRVNLPLGLPQVTDLRLGGGPLAGREPAATFRRLPGPGASVNFSVTNPYARPIPNVSVGLLVDGRAVQTKQVGTMLAKQTRSMSFENVALPAGTREITIAIESAGSTRLAGSVTTKISVDMGARQTAEQGGPARATPPDPTSSTGPRIMTAPAVRSLLPETFQVGRAAVPAAPVQAPTATTGPAISQGSRVARQPDTGATRSTPTPASADLSITASGSPANVNPGAVVTYTATVTNNGPAAAINMVFTETVPSNATVEEFRAPRGMLCSAPPAGATGTIRCTAASLPPGATSTFTLLARTAPNGSGGGVSSMMTVASDVIDPNFSNNRATAATGIALPAAPAGRRPAEMGPLASGSAPAAGSTTPVTGGRATRVPPETDVRQKHPDIGLSSEDIRLNSRDPQRLAVVVRVHNYGTASAPEVTLTWSGAKAPIQIGSIEPGAFKDVTVSLPPSNPPVRSVTIRAYAQGDVNLANNQATITLGK